jgi:hypothetical protein
VMLSRRGVTNSGIGYVVHLTDHGWTTKGTVKGSWSR